MLKQIRRVFPESDRQVDIAVACKLLKPHFSSGGELTGESLDGTVGLDGVAAVEGVGAVTSEPVTLMASF